MILVDIDLHTGVETYTLRLCEGGSPFVTTISGIRYQYDPRLIIPISFGIRISADEYGSVVRGSASVGDVEFALDEEVWGFLDYHWQGREIRIYVAEIGDTYEDFELVYKGQVENLTHDTLTAKVSIVSLGIKLDVPLISEFYDDTFPESIRGKPKPKLRGQGKSLAPVLINEDQQIYDVSSLGCEVSEVRVGGIVWNEGSVIPSQGEWVNNISLGTIQLGSPTLGLGVRCDAKSIDWASVTTAFLVREIVEGKDGSVDDSSMTQLNLDAPYLIGFYTSLDPINAQDALDLIMNGVVGFWAESFLGPISAGVIASPEETEDDEFNDVNIMSLNQTKLIAPAYRISVEYSRNWEPESNFAGEIDEVTKQNLSLGGVVVEVYENLSILNIEPRSVDVPLIRSLVNEAADVIEIRDRASAAWGSARKLYDLNVQDILPDLYSTGLIDYLMVNGNFRIHSVQRTLGGGSNVIQVWG